MGTRKKKYIFIKRKDPTQGKKVGVKLSFQQYGKWKKNNGGSEKPEKKENEPKGTNYN